MERKVSALRAGLYARVSTNDQTTANQLDALRAFARARGWGSVEFVDHGVSGAKERRPALDALLIAVRSRKVDIVACTKLDRLARSTHHLVTLAKELQALGVLGGHLKTGQSWTGQNRPVGEPPQARVLYRVRA